MAKKKAKPSKRRIVETRGIASKTDWRALEKKHEAVFDTIDKEDEALVLERLRSLGKGIPMRDVPDALKRSNELAKKGAGNDKRGRTPR